MKAKSFVLVAVSAVLFLAGCTTINGMFVSLQSGKNYIADAGLVFNGFQNGYQALCVTSTPQPFCASVAPKMKAASTAAISANRIAISAACMVGADPTSVGDLAARVAEAIYSVETIVQEAQAKSGRKSDALHTAVTVAGTTFVVSLQVATEILMINSKGATCDDLNSIETTIESADAAIQSS